jgi:hypothetical protein
MERVGAYLHRYLRLGPGSGDSEVTVGAKRAYT